MATCTVCSEELVNENTVCVNNCDETCCSEIIQSKCVSHNDETLETILATIYDGNTTFDAQCIGGVATETYLSAMTRTLTYLCELAGKTYDLSAITVGGTVGGTALTADLAIKFLISKIEEEH